MRIDFIADIGCLWSFIAWHRLKQALADYPRLFEIKPFLIQTTSPLFPPFAADKAPNRSWRRRGCQSRLTICPT